MTTERSDAYDAQSVQRYLVEHEPVWSHTTRASARSILRLLEEQEPLEALGRLGGYTQRIYLIRLSHYARWAGIEDIYGAHLKKHRRKYSVAYVRTCPKASMADTLLRIKTLPTDVQARASEVLLSGLRARELPNDGLVLGKGRKSRRVFGGDVPAGSRPVSYMCLYRALKSVGLKPHDLRKIFLNQVVANGANPFELAEIAGWSSIETARSYIQSSESRLRDLTRVPL